MTQFSYIRDPAEIYSASFAIVREEAALNRFGPALEPVLVRLVHSCGMVDIVDDFTASPGAVVAGREALAAGKPIFCDVEMVRQGIIETLLPKENPRICTLNDPQVPGLAKGLATTRSAAAVELWGDHLDGAIVCIGNAPTTLFHLLEKIADGAPKPAIIIGMPVGFVGAVESKDALAANALGLEFMTVHGRRGGSAMAASVVNALSAMAAS